MWTKKDRERAGDGGRDGRTDGRTESESGKESGKESESGESPTHSRARAHTHTHTGHARTQGETCRFRVRRLNPNDQVQYPCSRPLANDHVHNQIKSPWSRPLITSTVRSSLHGHGHVHNQVKSQSGPVSMVTSLDHVPGSHLSTFFIGRLPLVTSPDHVCPARPVHSHAPYTATPQSPRTQRGHARR